jgi:hypothetical protein
LNIKKTGRIRSRHHDIGPTIAIQVICRHSIDRPLAVAEGHCLILLSCSVVEIEDAWSFDIADKYFRPSVSIQIRGHHGIGFRSRPVELRALAEVAFAVIEVNKAAEILVAGGDIEMPVTVKVSDCCGTG